MRSQYDYWKFEIAKIQFTLFWCFPCTNHSIFFIWFHSRFGYIVPYRTWTKWKFHMKLSTIHKRNWFIYESLLIHANNGQSGVNVEFHVKWITENTLLNCGTTKTSLSIKPFAAVRFGISEIPSHHRWPLILSD